MRKLIVSFLCFSPLFISCHFGNISHQEKNLTISGNSQEEIAIHRIIKHDKKTEIEPIATVRQNQEFKIPFGQYRLSNECSFYDIQIDEKTPEKIYINKIKISLLGNFIDPSKASNNENLAVETSCYNKKNSAENSYTKKYDFDVLPGQNQLYISGKIFNFNFENKENQDVIINLSSLKLSTNNNYENSPYFISEKESSLEAPPQGLSRSDASEDDARIQRYAQRTSRSGNNGSGPVGALLDNKKMVSGTINQNIWLFPGDYSIEINGTSKQITIAPNTETDIHLSILRISSPNHFPYENRSNRGGGPISIYIDQKALLKLDTNYPIFAGQYEINIDDSGVKKSIDIKEDDVLNIKTYGAQILAYNCAASKTCEEINSRKITIHENRQSAPVMTVYSGIPFLLFDSKYQFAADEVKGILKDLKTSADGAYTDYLAQVKFSWFIKHTPYNLKTDFVRIESKGGEIVGKSMDMVGTKPSGAYIPSGDYFLTYYTGERYSPTNGKVRVDFSAKPQATTEIPIPIYMPEKYSDTGKKDIPDAPETKGSKPYLELTPLQ